MISRNQNTLIILNHVSSTRFSYIEKKLQVINSIIIPIYFTLHILFLKLLIIIKKLKKFLNCGIIFTN